jgi:hypothetical protein
MHGKLAQKYFRSFTAEPHVVGICATGRIPEDLVHGYDGLMARATCGCLEISRAPGGVLARALEPATRAEEAAKAPVRLVSLKHDLLQQKIPSVSLIE